MAKKSLGEKAIQDLDKLIQQSVLFAFENTEDVMPFVKKHAQAMSEEVIKKHIELYVNQYTIDLGEEGRKAIEYFCNG
jgi:1,4-dihydroxy-6-naphthoate synthase